jgi:hypothetical protein
LAAVALTFAGHLKTVRVHWRQHVDSRVIQKPSDVRVHRVTVHQILMDINQICIFIFKLNNTNTIWYCWFIYYIIVPCKFINFLKKNFFSAGLEC